MNASFVEIDDQSSSKKNKETRVNDRKLELLQGNLKTPVKMRVEVPVTAWLRAQ